MSDPAGTSTEPDEAMGACPASFTDGSGDTPPDGPPDARLNPNRSCTAKPAANRGCTTGASGPEAGTPKPAAAPEDTPKPAAVPKGVTEAGPRDPGGGAAAPWTGR
jgi:hypothetical protein